MYNPNPTEPTIADAMQSLKEEGLTSLEITAELIQSRYKKLLNIYNTDMKYIRMIKKAKVGRCRHCNKPIGVRATSCRTHAYLDRLEKKEIEN